jgi:hypothetical protein
MESALTPREIQTRIRAGATVAEVAEKAGIPESKVEAFAVPVLAEREFIATQAQSRPVRRADTTVPHRTLAEVVREKLSASGIDADETEWDAWKSGDRVWTVQIGYGPDDDRRRARFNYDQNGRYSAPTNGDASFLVGLRTPAAMPKIATPDAEKTVELNDDIAIMRALQPLSDPESQPLADREPQPLPDREFEIVPLPAAVIGVVPEPTPDPDADTGSDPEPTPPNAPQLRVVADPEDLDGYAEDDAYTEGELTEVDGVYDYVQPESGIDVLYEMLSGFDEDSVEIYRGLLDRSASEPSPTGAVGSDSTGKPVRPPKSRPTRPRAVPDPPSETQATTAPGPRRTCQAKPTPEPRTAPKTRPTPEPERAPRAKPMPEPESAPKPASPKPTAPDAEQPSLIEDAPAERPAKKSGRRAKVPSWDEIVFGSPSIKKRRD